MSIDYSKLSKSQLIDTVKELESKIESMNSLLSNKLTEINHRNPTLKEVALEPELSVVNQSAIESYDAYNITALKKQDGQFKYLFDELPVSLWEEDFSEVKIEIDRIKSNYNISLEEYLNQNPQEIIRLASKIKILDINKQTMNLLNISDKSKVLQGFLQYVTPDALDSLKQEFIGLDRGLKEIHLSNSSYNSKSEIIYLTATLRLVPGHEDDWSDVIISCNDISDLVRSSNETKQAQELYLSLINATPDGISLLNLNGELTFVSDNSVKMFGYSFKYEVLGKNVSEFISEEDRERAKQDIQIAFTDTLAHRSEYKLLKKDGTEFYCEIHGRQVKNQYGFPIGLVLVIRDVTERKISEENLRYYEALYKVAVFSTNQLVYEYNIQTGKIIWGGAIEQVTGYSAGEFESFDIEKWSEAIHPDDREKNLMYLDFAIANKQPFRLEYRFRKKNGEYVFIEDYGDFKAEDTGKMPNLVGLMHDITQRVINDRTLLESERQLRQIIDLVPHFIFAKDIKGRFILANQAVADVYGTTVEYLIGKTDSDFDPSNEEVNHFVSDDLKVIESGKTLFIPEEVITDSKGNIRYLTTTKIPFKFSGSHTEAVLGVSIDITEKKRVEEESLMNKQLIETTISGIPIVLFALDENGKFLLSEGRGLKSLGLEPGQVVGLSVFDIYKGNDEIINMIHRVLSGQTETSIIKAGELVYHTFCKPVFNSKGLVRGAIGVSVDITDSAKINEQLKESLEKYYHLTEEIPMFVCTFLPDGTLTYVNRTLAAVINKTPDEIIGVSFLDFLPPSANDMVKQKIASLTPTTPLESHEQNWTDNSGKEHYHLWINKAYFDVDGKIKWIQGVGIDITDLKRIEKALIESRRMFATLLSNLPGIAFRCQNDRNWTMEYLSLGTFELTGYQPEELKESRIISYNDLIHEDDREYVWNEIQKKLKEHKAYQIIYRIRTQSGGIKWVWEKGTGVYNLNGELEALEGFISDITERKTIETALIESESKFTTLYNSMNELVAVHEIIYQDGKAIDYTIKEVNNAYEKITGLNREDVIGRLASEIYKTAQAPYLHIYAEVAKTGHPKTFETYFDQLDKYFHISCFKPSEGQFATIASDVTDRKKAEKTIYKLNSELESRVLERTEQLNIAIEELRMENEEHMLTRMKLEKAKDELENLLIKEKELGMMKTRFISMISHEYRTPLTVILSSSYIIDRYINENKEKIKNHLNKIQSSVNIMTSLLDDVITIGKSEENRLEVNYERFSIKELTQSIVEEVKVFDSENHKFEFINNLQSDFILSDKKLLRQATLNLMTNACKFSAADSKITLKLDGKANSICIDVIDEGYGISEDDKIHIFEPFFRKKEYIGSIPGSGLGLAIVKRCVEAIDGDVSFESKIGVGSCFHINIPLLGFDD